MWGNRLGWGISTGMIVLVALLLVYLARLDNPSPPTDFTAKHPQSLAPLALPVSPGTVVEMNEPGDAAALCRQAINAYERVRSSVERFNADTRPAEVPKIEPALAPLVEARHVGGAGVFADRPQQLVTFVNEKPELEALRALGSAAVRVAMIRRQDDPEAAMRYAEAAFALGARLFAERLTYLEMQVGLELMQGAAMYIADIAKQRGDAPRAERAQRFLEATRGYVIDKVVPVYAMLSSIDERVVDRHPGDVFKIARESQDRMWRVEAVFKLGRYRFFAARVGDQNGASRLVRKMADTEPDPVVKLAAQAARDLTIEQYRMMR